MSKLYTEEQMKSAFIVGMLKGKASSIIHPFESFEMYISDIPPIELPSDEEIVQSSPYKLGGGNYNPLANFHRFEGAFWMKEQILNQNK